MGRYLYRLSCICTLCLFLTTLQAERNYRQGFIITLQKDTIYGQIDFRTDHMNSQRCVFRPDSTVQEKTYYPFDIEGYRFTDDGKMYLSQYITMKKDETSRSVFLECLVKGIKSLYYLDNQGIPIYFVDNGDNLVTVGAGADISFAISSDLYKKDRNWEKEIFPGYYAGIGMNVQLSKNKKQALNIRFQFKNLRDMMVKKNFAHGWSGTLGYTLQIL